MYFEPEHTWTTKSGLPAFIRINTSGYRCGYVDISFSRLLLSLTETYYHTWDKPIPTLEPLYDAFNDISVHGGVTFNDFIDSTRCIGFDCAHAGDAPIPEHTPNLLSHLAFNGGVLRSLDYCIDECESLANQLLVIHNQFSYLLDEFPEEFI